MVISILAEHGFNAANRRDDWELIGLEDPNYLKLMSQLMIITMESGATNDHRESTDVDENKIQQQHPN